MRFVTLRSAQGCRLALVTPAGYVDVQQADPNLPASLRALLELGRTGFDRMAAVARSGRAVARESATLAPAIPDAEKIICVGLNYADHAQETGAKLPTEPVIFNKFPTALRAHGETIVLPRASSQVDYEAELVVVIGRQGKNIPRETALEYVAGYCCGHDVSARDWQKGKPGGQWLLGKGFDTFAPLGPEFVTADEVGDAGNLRIQLRLNGETMQNSSTSQLIFPIDFLVSYVSQVCTLKPGDLIYTGTPAGVGMARTPPVFLKPGDVVEVEIERVGLLVNPVVAE